MITLLFIALALLANSALANQYQTSFPNPENPLSEGGQWYNGGTIGIDWADCQSLGGWVTGTQVYLGDYNDSTAVLTGNWGPDQTVTATVHQGSSWRSVDEEIELRVRTTITPHSISGYELDFRNFANGGWCSIVRWNGALNDFTTLANSGDNWPGITDGDLIVGTAKGNVISIFLNGVLMCQARDNTFAFGNPGIGFWQTTASGGASTKTDFGWSTFSATDGGSPVPPPVPTPTVPSTPTPPPPGSTPKPPKHLHIVH